MVSIIRLFTDKTFEETKKTPKDNKLPISNIYTPEFGEGESVFKERLSASNKFKFWKKQRNLIILVDGCPKATELRITASEGEKPCLYFNFGTMKEAWAYIAKVVAKSKADQKPISTWQFVILAVMMGGIIALQFALMKGVKF